MEIEHKKYADKYYQVTDTGTWFHIETPEPVIRLLESMRGTNTRVRLFLGDTETGEAWADAYGVCGTIGRSMGPVKVPLMISSKRSLGGGAILDHCIVGILVGKRWAYRHPKLDLGKWTYHSEDTEDIKACVKHNGTVFSRHDTMAKAYRFYQFMTGERAAP